MFKPLEYTSHEAVEWQKWPDHARMPDWELAKQLTQRSRDFVIFRIPSLEDPSRIMSIKVHSLAFTTPLVRPFVRWDCINGFES